MNYRAALALLFFSVWLPGQDRSVSINWIGQSCFVIRSADGQTVITDPPAPSVGYQLPALTADAVTITHNHTDHNNSAAVTGKFTLLDGRPVTSRQEVSAGSMPFVMIPGFHDNQNGAVRGPNTMMRWTQGGLKFAHLGDLGQDQLTDAQRADLTGVEVMFIPAGGFFTVTPDRAAAYVRELNPRIAILMHYKTALGGAAQTSGLPDAAAPFSPLIYKPATVSVSPDTLPAFTETWVMQPASDTVSVNAAAFQAGAPVAPGSVVSLFGKFTGSTKAAAPGFPLPRKLGETEVLVDGKAVPLYYAAPDQINVQLSSGQPAGQALADVRVSGQTVGRAPVTVVPNAPGLFVAANRDGTVNSPTAPARLGEVLQIYGTGLGAVRPAVDDGAAAGATPVSSGLAAPNVFLMLHQLPVQFSGLAPGFAGLWQLNVTLPPDAPTGTDLILTVVSGTTSNPLKVSVRP